MLCVQYSENMIMTSATPRDIFTWVLWSVDYWYQSFVDSFGMYFIWDKWDLEVNLSDPWV